MAITKQQKMLIGVVVAGVCALAADRFLIGPPESASASQGAAISPEAIAANPLVPQAAEVPGATTTNAQDPATPGSSLPSFESLTQRLIKAQTTQATQTEPQAQHDPFGLPAGWDKRPTQQAIDAQPKPESTVPEPLLSQYKLDGTYRSVVDGQVKSFAVINGHVMSLGQGIKVRLAQPLAGSESMVEVFRLIKVRTADKGPSKVVWESTVDYRLIEMSAPSVLPDGSSSGTR